MFWISLQICVAAIYVVRLRSFCVAAISVLGPLHICVAVIYVVGLLSFVSQPFVFRVSLHLCAAAIYVVGPMPSSVATICVLGILYRSRVCFGYP